MTRSKDWPNCCDPALLTQWCNNGVLRDTVTPEPIGGGKNTRPPRCTGEMKRLFPVCHRLEVTLRIRPSSEDPPDIWALASDWSPFRRSNQ